MGFGEYSDLTLRVVQTIRDSEIIIGSNRQVDLAKKYNHIARIIKYEKISEIIQILKENTFIMPSFAKGGNISAIVPFVSHVDHTEQDVKVIITEYGYADLRGLAPRQRVPKMIALAHPDYRPLLEEYYENCGSVLSRVSNR